MKIEEIATKLFEMKKIENEIKQERIELEEKLAALLDHPEEGTKTFTLENGLKVTIAGKLSYKVSDEDGFVAYCEKMIDKPIKIKTELDQTKLKAYRADGGALWRELSKFLTVEPAKTSVTVKA